MLMIKTLCFNPCSYGSFVLTRLNIQTCIFQWFCIHFAFWFLYSIDSKSILFHVNFAFFRNLYRYIHIEISVFQCYIQTEMKKTASAIINNCVSIYNYSIRSCIFQLIRFYIYFCFDQYISLSCSAYSLKSARHSCLPSSVSLRTDSSVMSVFMKWYMKSSRNPMASASSGLQP